MTSTGTRALLEALPDPAAVVSGDGRIVAVNRAFATLFQATVAALVDRSLYALASSHEAELAAVLQRCRRSTTALPFGLRLRRHDGVVVASRARGFLLDAGAAAGEALLCLQFPSQAASGKFLALNAEVALLKRQAQARRVAEDALREREHFLQRVIDVTPGLLHIFDLQERRLSLVNPAVQATLGYTPQEMLALSGRALSSLFHPEDLPRVDAHLLRLCALGDEQTADVEYRVRDRYGAWHWLHSRDAVFLRDVNGRALCVIGTAIDVTERRELEVALKHEARRKDEFLATLAHELRNPLAPMRSGTELLRLLGTEQPAAARALTIVERQIDHMVRLVDDLMDVSRITQGKIGLHRQPLPLASVIDSALEICAPLMQASGHALQVDVTEVELVVDADLTRLAQVFVNLLNNAARYTARGGRILLTVERQGDEARVAVRDNGIGIPAEQLLPIFEMFSQYGHGPQRAQGGLGVGLSLARRLTEMHGGRIVALSEGPGKGAEFVVHLPLVHPGRQQPGLPQTGADGAGLVVLRVLVVDDNRDGAELLADTLRLMGHDTRTAHDGLQALGEAETFRPQVVLLDIGLPGIDGFEVCRRLRRQAWAQQCLLVAVTGWGSDDDRRRTREAGFDHHLVKPVAPQHLARLLVRIGLSGGPPPGYDSAQPKQSDASEP